MPCRCGKVTVPTKKVAAKKVTPRRVAPKKGDPSPASRKASAIATKKAVANNPFAKGCNCT